MFSFPKVDPQTKIFTVEIKNVDLSVVNAIRRIILTNIPVVGFKGEDDTSLQVIVNNGSLHNEIMLHRFGLIPIHFTEEETENFVQEDYEFEIDVNNETENRINVTSEDFKVRKNGMELTSTDVKRLFPPNYITKSYILITRLQKGQHLHVKGHAIKTTANISSSFCPVSLSNFKYITDPKEAVKADNVLDKERAYLKNEYGEPIAFQFEIETENALTPKYLFTKAIEILMNKIHKINENINNLEIREGVNNAGYEIVFENEDDTLGSFLQSLMYDHYIRQKNKTEKNRDVTYVGYYCPHPLDTTMIVKICIEDTDNIQEYRDLLYDHCHRSLEYLQNMQSEFVRVMV